MLFLSLISVQNKEGESDKKDIFLLCNISHKRNLQTLTLTGLDAIKLISSCWFKYWMKYNIKDSNIWYENNLYPLSFTQFLTATYEIIMRNRCFSIKLLVSLN